MHNSFNRNSPIDRELVRKVRHMFFRQKFMADIEKATLLPEWIIRKFIVVKNGFHKKRERYLRYLASYAFRHSVSLVEMAKSSDVCYYALNRVRNKYRIKVPAKTAWNRRITPEIEDAFVREYKAGATADKIANEHGFKTGKTVCDSLAALGVKRRAPKIVTHYDESFFEKINSHEKAYILGLIMTDGYILRDYCGFGIQLTESDGYVLADIAKFLGASSTVKRVNCASKRRMGVAVRDMVRLCVYNRKIANDLRTLGVIRNKSKTLRYRNVVPKRYLSSFFRGLFDGDGTIGLDGRGYPFVCICSASLGFLKDISCSKSPFRFSINSGSKYPKLRIAGGRKEMYRFYRWIYKHKGELFLRRKYEKVQSCIN